ncbi:hypothetical protein IDZ49_11795 [Francisella tularensis]|nr:hypothetical protein [Francisella tularensis]
MQHRMPTPRAKFLTDKLVTYNEISFPTNVTPSIGDSSISTFKVISIHDLKPAYDMNTKIDDEMIEQVVTGD